MNSTYFYIEPYVYSNIKNNELLLFDTFSGNYLLKKIDKENLCDFLNKLFAKNKFRIVEYKSHEKEENIENFINTCRSFFMGDLHYGVRPLLRPFKSRVFNDVAHLKTPVFFKNVYSLVKQLNIVIGKSTHCKNEELNCNGIKQFLFPFENEKDNGINTIKLYESLSRLKFNLDKISVVGDFYRNTEILDIVKLYPKIPIWYYSYYLDFCEDILASVNLEYSFFLFWIDLPINQQKMNEIMLKIREYAANSCMLFIITSEKEVEEVENAMCDNTDIESKLIPFFNGSNYSFFEKNVYLNEEDILSQKLTEENIFSNMHINTNYFGKLYFMPNNKIYTAPSSYPLGNYDDPWETILRTKLLKDPFWFKIRKEQPCKDCIFQFLCPPLSNYEHIMGQNNLCHLHK